MDICILSYNKNKANDLKLNFFYVVAEHVTPNRRAILQQYFYVHVQKTTCDRKDPKKGHRILFKNDHFHKENFVQNCYILLVYYY